jgi:hypothetical protein
MRDKFAEVCQTILRYRLSPNRLVRRTVITYSLSLSLSLSLYYPYT